MECKIEPQELPSPYSQNLQQSTGGSDLEVSVEPVSWLIPCNRPHHEQQKEADSDDSDFCFVVDRDERSEDTSLGSEKEKEGDILCSADNSLVKSQDPPIAQGSPVYQALPEASPNKKESPEGRENMVIVEKPSWPSRRDSFPSLAPPPLVTNTTRLENKNSRQPERKKFMLPALTRKDCREILRCTPSLRSEAAFLHFFSYNIQDPGLARMLLEVRIEYLEEGDTISPVEKPPPLFNVNFPAEDVDHVIGVMCTVFEKVYPPGAYVEVAFLKVLLANIGRVGCLSRLIVLRQVHLESVVDRTAGNLPASLADCLAVL